MKEKPGAIYLIKKYDIERIIEISGKIQYGKY